MMVVFTSVALLRYLAIAQRNNYSLPLNKKVISFFGYTIGLICPLVVMEVLLPTSDLFLAIKIIANCLVIIATYYIVCKYKGKADFTRRARTNYFATISITTVSLLIINSILKQKVAIFVTYATILIIPAFLYICMRITNIYFEKKNKIFAEREIAKLDDTDLIKIAITGSFGKTSCKNILLKMLSKEFATIATEGNFNTPMGIAFTVQRMKGNEKIFIAEMGARHRGDIRYLCKLFKPEIGIITGVCAQHLKTFKSLHEIYLEKNELSKASAVCVFNGNDKYALKMYKERQRQKYKISIDKEGDIYADNIRLEGYASIFNLHIGENTYEVKTRLLGKHNILNILLCAMVAKYLKVSDGDIISAIEEIQPIPHRLEYSFHNGIHIIDDGYNSNEVGIKCAMEVLDGLVGRKVVVSQGLVECGRKNKQLNITVGKTVAEHADVIILCGPNKKLIAKGVKSVDFNGELYSYSSLKKAQKDFHVILKTGDILLLQNDIPDTL